MKRFDDTLRTPTVNGDGVVSILIAGGIDLPVIDELVTESLRVDTTRVRLDLAGITAVDAAGVGALAYIHENLRAGGCVLEVHRAPSGVTDRLIAAGILADPAKTSSDGTIRALARFERRMRAHPTPTVQYAAAMEAAYQLTDADLGNVQVLDRITGYLHIREQRGFGEPFIAFFDSVADHGSACGAALANRELVLVDDVAASPVFAGTPARDVVLDAGVRAVASVPYLDPAGRPAGVLSVHRRDPAPLSRRQQLLLRIIAERLGSSTNTECRIR
ncbi:MAG: GAF domain-containing protein [Pseudonocardiaceae bacterium]